ncbi:unnamed protein product [Arabidopsis lyrata]|nr:unnamed protein product [Arabidopsis lyrata]
MQIKFVPTLLRFGKLLQQGSGLLLLLDFYPYLLGFCRLGLHLFQAAPLSSSSSCKRLAISSGESAMLGSSTISLPRHPHLRPPSTVR